MRNHYEMGRLIYSRMAEHNLSLNPFFFLFGGLAPDLSLSFLYRPHERAASEGRFRRLLDRLCGDEPCRLLSYRLGLLTHYICDFLCYAHTPAFQGGLREHIRYEKGQTVSPSDMLPFPAKKIAGLSRAEMTSALDKYISSRERLLTDNAGMSYSDIPVAMHVATWAVACVWVKRESCAAIPQSTAIV